MAFYTTTHIVHIARTWHSPLTNVACNQQNHHIHTTSGDPMSSEVTENIITVMFEKIILIGMFGGGWLLTNIEAQLHYS